MKKFLLVIFFLSTVLLSSPATAFVRDEVIRRDHLLCGVSTGIPGFSHVDGKGNWSGIDVDICRAVAAAVLGDASKVKYIPLLPKERVTALLAGDVDILSRNLAWNLTRDSSLNMNFAAVTFYDLQGFLASVQLGVKSLLELKEFSVCLLAGTNSEESLADYLQESGLKYKAVVTDTPDQIVKDFEEGRCGVIAGGRAQLQGIRSKMIDPAAAVFLSEVIENIPLGPAVRQGDDLWLNIVKWSVFAMINGEELQLTSENIDLMADSPNRAVQRFLGMSGIGGKGLGLSDKWAYQIIKQVGNYGESFSRNLGEASPLKLKRGLNNLWSNGGILFAPPLR
ncbi:MAG: amino acid ABC transporter substrate-binding protein [Desulfopila sp.]|jgi:general L-amino acid transport system substrate-binding protein|nr:amino acid ABC transporter substrate-binding protein [Desulfopila sp.]